MYAYYHELRMNEAAFLLKNKNMSLSEFGYTLGFINLSHFTRVFEEYIGINRKSFRLHHYSIPGIVKPVHHYYHSIDDEVLTTFRIKTTWMPSCVC